MRQWIPGERPTQLTLLLIVVMIAMLAYLTRLDSEIESYSGYEARIQKMLLLDKSFNNFVLRKIDAIDYERINTQMDDFEDLLFYFLRQPLDREFGGHFLQQLKRIETLYRKKRHAIEHFKSYNAESINSIHYIFDLRRTLANDPALPPAIQSRLDTILFNLMQLILGIETSTEGIRRQLRELRTLAHPLHDRHLLLFLDHNDAIILSVHHLLDASREAMKVPLARALERFENSLRHSYREKMRIEKFFALLFFVLSFMLLIVVLWLQQRANQTSRRLQAFMYAVENSDNTIVMTDTDRRIVYVNETFEKSSGYTKEEAIGQNPRILKSGIQDESYYAEMNRVLDAGEKWQGEFINKRKDGSLFYEKASIVPVFVDGKLTNYLAIKLDITQYIEQQKKLKLSAAVFENAQESIFITDKENRIIAVNKAFTAITGYREEEVLGKNPNILKSGRHEPGFYRKMWRSIRETGRWHGKIYNRIKSGEVIPTWLTITSLYDDKGELLNYIGMLTDLREIIQNQERAEFLAYHDTLTGLPNRAYFEEHLFHAIELAARRGTILAVLFIDLDRFKVINDTLGHDVGDRLLEAISARMRAVLRKSDMLARIGGDEFVAVIETINAPKEATHVCEKLLEKITEPVRIGAHMLNVSASIGVALYPDNGTTITDLIKNADNAMYHAKNMGRNNFQFFVPELSRQMHRRLEIEQGLNHADIEEEFWIAYQPQYRLEDGTVYGAEALLRWRSPTLGIVTPDEFIPVAEETGRINALGRFVFTQACRTFARLKEAGLPLENISVNVSSRQFTDTDLPDFFLETVHGLGLRPEQVTIEMTERYIMDTSAYDDSILHRLKKSGFKISVDDFGTGYSSMSYLKILPIDTIKIDKSFITDIPYDHNDNEITRAIIALSDSLGYKVVAEGIEHVEQERFLIENGCHYGQGYLFSRPLTSGDFERFVQECRAEE